MKDKESILKPWFSIAAGLAVDDEIPSLDVSEDQLCLSCKTSPCCTTVALKDFEPDSLEELEQVRYWLGFERLVIGIWRQGRWSLLYREACHHLDQETLLCNVHGSAMQPLVCRQYNSRSCTYRGGMAGRTTGSDLILLDMKRFKEVLKLVKVSERGLIASFPTFDEIRAAVIPINDSEIQSPKPAPRSTRSIEYQGPIRADRIGGLDPKNAPQLKAWESPCVTCRAPCCENVFISYDKPRTAAETDFINYLLGFKGLLLGIEESSEWSIVIQTQCMNFDAVNHKCNVFGTDERPELCNQLDAWNCNVVRLMDPDRPSPLLLLDHGGYTTIRHLMPFDDEGTVTAWPTRQEALTTIVERLKARTVVRKGE